MEVGIHIPGICPPGAINLVLPMVQNDHVSPGNQARDERFWLQTSAHLAATTPKH